MADSKPSVGETSKTNEVLAASLERTCTIALLCGGNSNEREVSLSGASHVGKGLTAAGHKVVTIDTADPNFSEMLRNTEPDVAFISLHGKGGEDGTLQGVLELMNIPYTGSGVLGSALALDKYRSKIIYEAHGLKTPFALSLKAKDKDTPAACSQNILEKIDLPVVVKPIDDGSSFGVTIVKDEEALAGALASAFASGSDVLVEKFVSGTEITVGVLGSKELVTLPPVEIVPKNEFYDYESKYAEGGSEHIIPARISAKALEEANRSALAAHEALGCYGVSRTDMIIDDEDTVWVIETNTIPGMTSTSLLPDAAKQVGISSQKLYELLVGWALERDLEKTR